MSSPASAHDEIQSSSPADGATVSAGVIPIELTFDEAVMDSPDGSGTEISVTDADGNEYADSCIGAIDGGVITDSVDLDKAGEYTVNWRTVSQDGHPVEGVFSFVVENNDGYVAQPVADCALAYASGTPEVTSANDDEAPALGIDPLTGLLIGIGLIVVISVIGAFRIRDRELKAEEAAKAKRKSQS